MMKLLQMIAILLTSVMTLTLSSVAIAGDVYKGTWSGEGGDSTLDIRSVAPLIIKYCFNNNCSLQEPTGSVKSMKVKFPKNGNFPGATLKFKKSGETYKGTYKQKGHNETYTISMSK